MALSTSFTSLLTGSSTPFLASGDVVAFIDISDHTQSVDGSTVKGTLTQFFAQLPVPVAIASASATAFTVGLNGATNPAFAVDDSTALQVAGLKVTGAVTGGTVAVVVTDSGAATNLTLNAKGTGTIGIGSVSTGRVTISPVMTITGSLTLSAALVYGGVTLSNAVTGTGNMVLSASPTFTGTVTAATITASGLITASAGLTVASGQTLTVTGATITGLTAASVATGTFPGVYTVTGALTLSAALTYGGVTLSNAVTGTGNMVLSAGPTFTGTVTAATITASGLITASAGLTATTGTFSANAAFIANTGAGTASKHIDIANTGGSTIFGTEISTGGNIFTGSSAYASVLGSTTTTAVQIATNNTVVATFASGGGLTLTAGISATTGTFSTSAKTASGSTSCPTGTATTLFTVSVAGQFLYCAFNAASGIYQFGTAFSPDGASVVFGGGTALSLAITASGASVQATQSTGSTKVVSWSYIQIA